MISDDSKDSIMYTNNNHYEHKFIKNKILKNVIIIIFIMSMATLIGLFFKVIDLNESSIILVFIRKWLPRIKNWIRSMICSLCVSL